MIILATHFETSPLPEPFVEVRRQDCEFTQGVRTSSFFWSEYAAFLSQPAKGWMHYRCVLNPTGYVIPALPWESRPGVLGLLGRIYDPNVTYVGKDACCDKTVLEQFLECHKEAESFLIAGCDAYKSITGDNAVEYMRKTRGFTARNLVVGPLVSEWSSLAIQLITELDNIVELPDTDRYGGYVLERLFSFFVSRRNVQKVDYLYFDHPPHLHR